MMANIGLGTANLGSNYGFIKNPNLSDPATSLNESFEILDNAYNAGIRILDTAHHYGQSENIIGQYLRLRKKHDLHVISKFIPTNMEAEFEQSKKELGSNLKSILWHNFESKNRSLFQAQLESLKNKNPNITFGCSTYGIENAELAIDSGLFESIEIEYNFLNPYVLKKIRNKILPKKMKIILRSILQKGFLTNEFHTSKRELLHRDAELNTSLLVISEKLTAFSKKLNLSIEEIALRYAFSTTYQSEIVLVAAHTKEILQKNLSYWKKEKLSPTQIEEIESIAKNTDSLTFDLRFWNN